MSRLGILPCGHHESYAEWDDHAQGYVCPCDGDEPDDEPEAVDDGDEAP